MCCTSLCDHFADPILKSGTGIQSECTSNRTVESLQRIGQSQPPKSWSEVSPRKYTPPDVVISRYSKYKNQCDIGRLAVALAKYTYFGEEVMRRSTLTGTRNKDTIPLDPEKLKSKDIRGVFPSNLSEQEFTHIWGRCVASHTGMMCGITC